MNVCETKKNNFATSLMMLICASALWGSTFIFTKVLIDYISVSYILFFRSALTAILLYFMFIKSPGKSVSINQQLSFPVFSLLFQVPLQHGHPVEWRQIFLHFFLLDLLIIQYHFGNLVRVNR